MCDYVITALVLFVLLIVAARIPIAVYAYLGGNVALVWIFLLGPRLARVLGLDAL